MLSFRRLFLHRRAAKRTRKLAQKLRDADAVISSHTKSGRTWLRVMVSSAYQFKYGVASDLLIEGPNFHKICSQVPNVHFGSVSVVDHRGRQVERLPDHKPVVFLIRDPRDTAASFYYHLKHRASDIELVRKGLYGIDISRMDLFDFMRSDLGVCRVVDFIEKCLSESRKRSRVLVVRYEDMLQDAVPVLSDILDVIDGSTFNDEALRHAVKCGSLNEMRTKERSGYYRTNRLGAPTDADQPDSWKVRRAQPGHWRMCLSDEQVKVIDDLAAAYGGQDRQLKAKLSVGAIE